MEAELGAALGDAFDAVTSGTDGSSDVGGETPDGGDLSAEPDATGFDAEPIVEPEAPEGGDPNAQPQSGAPADSPWPMSEDGKTVLMPRTELDRVKSAMGFADQVGQIFASPQEAQTAAGQASDLRQITNDWLHGSDEAIQSFMNHWMGQNHRDPAVRQSCQRSFSRMLGMALPALKQMDPSTHSSFMGQMSKDLVASLYEKAAASGNPQDLLDAQSVDWGMNGTYQKELPKQDPAAQEKARFEAEQKEFRQRQEAAYQRDVKDFNASAVEGAKFKQLDAAIDKQLEKVKARFGDVAYEDLKAGIRREVQQAVAARQDWFTEHRQTYDGIIRDYQTTWHQGSPGQGLQPRVQAYIAAYQREAQRVLPSIAAKRISATTQARTTGQNGTARPPARQAPAANRTPSPAGQNGSQGRLSSDQWDAELRKTLQVR